MPDIVASEMAKAKVGFAVRFGNKDLPEDALLPDKFFEHNQAAFEFFLSIQEAADRRMELSWFFSFSSSFSPSNTQPAAANNEDDNAVKPVVSIKPFIKQEKNLRFFIVPVLSLALFPQFRGARQPGVLRMKGQKGMCLFGP